MAARPSLWLITLAMLFLSWPLDAFASRSNFEAKKMMVTTTAAEAAARSRIDSSEVRVMEEDEEESRRFRSTAASARQVPTGPDPIHHHGGPSLGRRRLLQ